MGYGQSQMDDLRRTINSTDCDLVVIATPLDLSRLISINKPTVRVQYEYKDKGTPTLEELIIKKLSL